MLEHVSLHILSLSPLCPCLSVPIITPFSTAPLSPLTLCLCIPPLVLHAPCLALTPTQHSRAPLLLLPTLPLRPSAGALSLAPLEGAGAECLCIRYCYDTAPHSHCLSSRASPQQRAEGGWKKKEGAERMRKRGQGTDEGRETERKRERERDSKRATGKDTRTQREGDGERESRSGLEDTASLCPLPPPLGALSRGL